MKTPIRKINPTIILLLFITVIPFAHAQDIQYQAELLDTLQTGEGIEISTNKINFTVKNNEGTPLSGQQVLVPVIVDDQSSAFTVATPPTDNDGVTSLVFQNVTKGDSKIVFADLSSLTLQQELQPLGCCQIEYVEKRSILPLAICAQSIQSGFSCGGQMTKSGAKSLFNAGIWTDYSEPCQTAVSVKPTFCASETPVQLGGIRVTAGMSNKVFLDFFDCWKQNSNNGTRPWKINLPVIDCPDGVVPKCPNILGAVTLNVMWVRYRNNMPPYYPTVMAAVPPLYGPWASTDPNNADISWQNFASYFDFKTANNELLPFERTAIYYLPVCENPVHIKSCFTGYMPDNKADCYLLDSVYRREGIGNTFWGDNYENYHYTCNQQSRQCEGNP